jgi:hypothetical protein
MLKGNSNKKKVGFRDIFETPEADFDDFWLDFLGEFEAIFESALAHESGPPRGIVWWKKPRVENLMTPSL